MILRLRSSRRRGTAPARRVSGRPLGLAVAACSAGALLLGACGDAEEPDGVSAPPETATTAPGEATTTSVEDTTTTVAEPDGVHPCAAGAVPGSAEQAALCVYDAFVRSDRDAAARWATEPAVEELWALGGFPTDDQWRFDGCGDPRESAPPSGVACHFTIPGEPHGVAVELAMTDAHVVDHVVAIG